MKIIPPALLISVALLLTGAGCTSSVSQSVVVETAEQQASRIFSLAQDLEATGRTKQAYAAYHQIIRNFSSSAYAIKANIRIRKAQASATRTPKRVSRRS